MQHFIVRILIFAVLNFGALGLGTYFMGGGPSSGWYQNLNKAPWTPPGWVFGAAWTTIMIFFSIFMWRSTKEDQRKNHLLVYGVFSVQLVLNIFWNPVFFANHQLFFSLMIIVALTLLIILWMMYGFKKFGAAGLLLLPYALWLVIATSLNAYAWLYN